MIVSIRPQLSVAFWLPLLAVLPIWLPVLPLGTDLPQHAEQMSLIRDLMHAGHWSSVLELHWVTPYVLTYALGLVLLPFMSPVMVTKALASVAIVLVFVGTQRLLAAYRADTKLAPLALLGCYGLVYQWGFLPFSISVGLTLLLLAECEANDRELAGRFRMHVGELVLVLALLLTHGLGALVAGGLMLCRALCEIRRDIRVKAYLYVLLLTAPIAAWRVAAGSTAATLDNHVVFGLSPIQSIYSFYLDLRTMDDAGPWAWGRLTGFFPRILGMRSSELATVLGMLFCLLPLMMGYRFTRHRQRWGLFVGLFAALMLVPSYIAGTILVSERLSVFFFCLLPLIFEATSTPSARFRTLMLTGVVLSVVSSHAVAAMRLDQESRALIGLIEKLPAHGRVLYIPPHDRPADLIAPPLLHSGHWYAVLRGGLVDPNFSTTQLQPLRYRAGQTPFITMEAQPEWGRRDYSWRELQGDNYDVIISWGDEQMLESKLGCQVQHSLHVSGHWVAWDRFRRQPCSRPGAVSGHDLVRGKVYSHG